MQIDVSHAIEGINQLLENVEQALTETSAAVAESYHEKMVRATDYPFQTVPSYILEHKYKSRSGVEVNAKVYPEGTLATFATTTPHETRLGNLQTFTGQDDQIVQHYGPITNGPLHSLLATSDVRSTDQAVSVDVGYPQGIGTTPGTEHIAWVYFGTVKMIPRPFIEEIVFGDANDYYEAIVQAVNGAIDRSTGRG